MNTNFFPGLVLFTWVGVILFLYNENVRSSEPTFQLILVGCFDGNSDELEAFTQRVNQNLSVSKVSVIRNCTSDTSLVSNGQILVLDVQSATTDTPAQIQVRLAEDPTSTQNESLMEKRRRDVPWGSLGDTFLLDTLKQEKSKTLALLLDNIALDFVGIRLAPTSITQADSISTPPPTTEKTFETARPIGTPIAKQQDCTEICESREDIILREMADTCAVPSPKKDDAQQNELSLGLAGGVSVLSSWYRTFRFSGFMAAKVRRVGVSLWLSLETDSTFQVESYTTDTLAGVLSLGPRFMWHHRKLSMGIEPQMVIRYVRLYRDDIDEAQHFQFADFGFGAYPVFQMKLNAHIGWFLRGGLEFFPKARTIRIENGPQRRYSMFSIPLQIGFFISF